jgi:hypothetical protein
MICTKTSYACMQRCADVAHKGPRMPLTMLKICKLGCQNDSFSAHAMRRCLSVDVALCFRWEPAHCDLELYVCMYVCMYVCICMYIYVCVCTLICNHMYVHVCTCIHVEAMTHVSMYTCMYIDCLTCMPVNICVVTCACACEYQHTGMLTCIWIFMPVKYVKAKSKSHFGRPLSADTHAWHDCTM